LAALLLPLAQGCEVTRHLAQDEMLIRSQPRYKGNEALSSDALNGAVKSQPNSRILLPKVKLHLYSLGVTLERDTSWLRKVYRRVQPSENLLNATTQYLTENIGEKPALVDTNQLTRDANNIESLYFSRGFMNAQVRYRVRPLLWNPKKARVFFHVQEGHGYRIRDIEYDSPNQDIARILKEAQTYAALQPGQLYNEDNLADERSRIADALRNHGYYTFNAGQVSYVIDTTIDYQPRRGQTPGQGGKPLLENILSANPNTEWLDVRVVVPGDFTAYEIGDIAIEIRKKPEDEKRYLEVDPNALTPARRDSLALPRRKVQSGLPMTFYTTPEILHQLNLNTVARQIRMRPGERYSLEEARAMQRRLQDIGIFKNTILRFEPNDSTEQVDLRVELSLLDRFNVRVGLESFQRQDNSQIGANLPGLGLNLEGTKRNAFRRGELLNGQLRGNISFYKPRPDASLDFYYNYSGRVNVRFPRLLLLQGPLRKLTRTISPTTTVSGSYNFDRPQEYLRTSTSLEYSYQWYHRLESPQRQSYFAPLQLTVVNSTLFDSTAIFQNLDPEQNQIRELIRRDFRPRFTSKASYFYTYSDKYSQDNTRLTTFFRAGFELGGNLPLLFDWLGKVTGRGDGTLQDGAIGGEQTYGQFVRMSWEGKAHYPFDQHNQLVGRLFLGYAKGLKYTPLIPLENRFFAGGTNSIRGWQSNTLGPGTYDKEINQILGVGGEYKLEMNAEYRFDMVSSLEGAFFVDAGNVWFSQGGGFQEPSGELSAETFQLGIAGGVGIRLDFSFVVIRLDLGQQLYAPDIQDWVLQDFPDDIGGERLQYNLAIGYPF
jgi:outer membrane protein assembly factor BamA